MSRVVVSFEKESFRDEAWDKAKKPQVLVDAQQKLIDEIRLRLEFFEGLENLQSLSSSNVCATSTTETLPAFVCERGYIQRAMQYTTNGIIIPCPGRDPILLLWGISGVRRPDLAHIAYLPCSPAKQLAFDFVPEPSPKFYAVVFSGS